MLCVEDSSVARWMPFVWRENKHSLHSFVYLSVRREQLQLFHQTGSKQDTCLRNQNWTRGCETEKLYERMAISHPPFRPFSHRDFHSKRLIPPSFIFTLCERQEWKSETTKSKWWIFKMVTMPREISRPSFVWRPFTCAPCHRASFLSSSSFGNLWGTSEQPF